MSDSTAALAPFVATRLWEQPEHVGLGRLPMRPPLDPYPDEVSARAGASPWILNLDGSWRFRLAGRPEELVEADVAAGTDDRDWAEIDVPGCWPLQGWDRPQYTNIRMPFPGPPPLVPDANPTGVYRRRFRLPTSVAGPQGGAARRGRRERAGGLGERHVGGVGHRQPPGQRARHHRAAPPGRERGGAGGGALVGPELRGGPGPLVARRTAPQRHPGVHRGHVPGSGAGRCRARRATCGRATCASGRRSAAPAVVDRCVGLAGGGVARAARREDRPRWPARR